MMATAITISRSETSQGNFWRLVASGKSALFVSFAIAEFRRFDSGNDYFAKEHLGMLCRKN